jgi:hypothetical protein
MAHANRMFSPMVTMFVGHTSGGIKLAEWRTVFRSRNTFKEASAAYAALETPEDRERFMQQFLRTFLGQFEFANENPLLDQLIDVFAKWFGEAPGTTPSAHDQSA